MQQKTRGPCNRQPTCNIQRTGVRHSIPFGARASAISPWMRCSYLAPWPIARISSRKRFRSSISSATATAQYNMVQHCMPRCNPIQTRRTTAQHAAVCTLSRFHSYISRPQRMGAATSAPALHATQPRATEPLVSHATWYPTVPHRGTRSLARWTAALRALHEERLARPSLSRRHRHIGFPVAIAMTEGMGRTPAEQHRLGITRLPWRSRKTWYSFLASVEL